MVYSFNYKRSIPFKQHMGLSFQQHLSNYLVQTNSNCDLLIFWKNKKLFGGFIFYPMEGDFYKHTFLITQIPKGMSLSNHRVYQWTKTTICFYPVEQMGEEVKVDFQLPPNDSSSIISVQQSMAKHEDGSAYIDRLILQVRVDRYSQSIIIWHNDINREEASFDATLNAIVMFNTDGNEYVIDEKQVIDCKHEVFIYSFNVDQLKLSWKYPFATDGHKINYNCDGILSDNSLALPFSFLTFIIRERNAVNELTDETFSVEGYLFRIGGANCFHQYADNYSSLRVCINGLSEANQDYLSMLLHPDSAGETPLGMVIQNGNKRTVHLIMESLSCTIKADSINTQLIKRHFKTLLDYQTFDEFLKNCFFQTAQMSQIESLNAQLEEGDKVLIDSHNTCFLENGFQQKFTEEEKPQRFVIIKAMDANWMLTDPDGEDFIFALGQVENPLLF